MALTLSSYRVAIMERLYLPRPAIFLVGSSPEAQKTSLEPLLGARPARQNPLL